MSLEAGSTTPCLSLLTVTLCTLLGACGSREHTNDASERVVHVYNWGNYIGPDTIPSFEAATGIHVVYDTFDSEEMLEGKLLAGDSDYDVVDASCDIIPSTVIMLPRYLNS